MASYIVIFRTHVWDTHVAAIARTAKASSSTGAFVVTVDETNGPICVEPHEKLSHTNDFSFLNLPNHPDGRSLWWNADYILFLVRQRFPSFDYYVMIEYDALVNTSLDSIIERCAQERIDLVVHQLQQISIDNHWSFPSISELTHEPWQALIPVLIVSAQAVDALQAARRTMASLWDAGTLKNWPYCEAFIPTMVKICGMKISALADFTDVTLLKFRPFISLRDPQLRRANFVAHPVMGGSRFVESFLAFEPRGSHVMTDGFLCSELAAEDPADVRAVLVNGAPTARPSGIVQPYPPNLSELAAHKPATQSSHSEWSNGPTADADAQLAISAPILDDYAFHTAREENPWWQVDLLSDHDIEQVWIVNRARNSQLFVHFRIELSPNAADWKTCFEKTDNAQISADEKCPAIFVLNEPARARYLRIVLLETGCLHLRHVKVFGKTA